jgi:hypothetical protein
MKCQVSVGVKLRRRALVLPQDGEQQGVKQAGKQTMTLFCSAGFCGIYGRWNTLAKNLHLRYAVAAAADPRCSPWASQKWRCDIVCVWADGTGECSMLGGIERSGVMVMKWSIIIIIPLHITGRVGCPRVLAHVGIIIFL